MLDNIANCNPIYEDLHILYYLLDTPVINAKDDEIDETKIITELPTALPLKDRKENGNKEWIKIINSGLNNLKVEDHNLKAILSLNDILSSSLKEMTGNIY